ncbi:hypothetical protein DSO57_1013233 [Entomophthora muscae]|uniref:Uncharacterized protein n=1 Tax=Entomophthora muscae TaxID=34485 RepID=A0ACC2TTC9_9FUNG|nr:hypothetical protein DSO57_1013233 [Entomophthora muscae]
MYVGYKCVYLACMEMMSNYTLYLIINVLNIVSLLAAVAVVVVILGAKLVDRRSVDHVTIRITLAISILDIMAFITHVCKTTLDLQDMQYFAAQSLQHWLLLAYLFLNMSIAVNLQLVYVHEYEFNPTWEQLYWVVSFVLATLSALAAPGNHKSIKTHLTKVCVCLVAKKCIFAWKEKTTMSFCLRCAFIHSGYLCP